ncbi:alpha/beta hydrolase [Planctomycetaceae bacterium SH139]
MRTMLSRFPMGRSHLASFCTRLSCLTLIFAISLGGSLRAADPKFEITKDVVYGHKAGMALTYDVIRQPEKSNGAAVIFMMSGGWVSSWIEPESFVSPALPAAFASFPQLVEKGYALVIMRHGSAPYFKVPDAVEDVTKGLEHVRSSAARFGFDPARIGVFGASAGGHLSLMASAAPKYGELTSEDRSKQRIAAAVAYFPPVDLRELFNLSGQFPALDFDRDEAENVSPLLYVTADDPPTLLVHGDADRLVQLSHSKRYLAALEAAKVPADLMVFEGVGHGFSGQEAKRATEALIAWFDKYLAANSKAANSDATDN